MKTTITALVIPADATTGGKTPQFIEIEPGQILRTAQGIVGGLIEGTPVRVEDALSENTVYVNEEGLFLPLDHNPIASFLAQKPLVGDAIVFGPPDQDGNTTSITPGLIEYWGAA